MTTQCPGVMSLNSRCVQKESILLKQKTGARTGSRLPSRSKAKPPDPPAATPPVDAQEEDFWNTPGAPARTLRFTGDLLTDEQLDLAELDSSLTSPFPDPQAPDLPRPPRTSRAMQFTQRDMPQVEEETTSAPEDAARTTSSDDDDDEGDETVILTKEPVKSPPLPTQSDRHAPAQSDPSASQSATPVGQPAKPKLRVTTELESIVVRRLNV